MTSQWSKRMRVTVTRPSSFSKQVFWSSIIGLVCALFVGVKVVCDFLSMPRAISLEEFDVGEVAPSEKIIGAFEIKNNGWKTFHLRPESTCKCLPVDIQDTTLSPGAVTLAQFVLKTPTKAGKFTQLVTIKLYSGEEIPTYSEELIENQLDVKVIGSVTKGVQCFPESVTFSHIPWGSQAKGEVGLRALNKDVRFLSVTSSSPVVSSTLDSTGHRDATINIEVRHAFYAGSFSGALLVHTSNEAEPYKIVPIYAVFGGPVHATPPVILFRGVSQDDVARDIELSLRANGRLSLVPPSLPSIRAKLEPIEEAKRYRLSVLLSPKGMVGNMSSSLSISFEDAEGHQDELTIPVYATLRSSGPTM